MYGFSADAPTRRAIIRAALDLPTPLEVRKALLTVQSAYLPLAHRDGRLIGAWPIPKSRLAAVYELLGHRLRLVGLEPPSRVKSTIKANQTDPDALCEMQTAVSPLIGKGHANLAERDAAARALQALVKQGAAPTERVFPFLSDEGPAARGIVLPNAKLALVAAIGHRASALDDLAVAAFKRIEDAREILDDLKLQP